MRYVNFGNAGTATTTAASAGLIGIQNPTSTTMSAGKIYEFSVGPAANSADNTYAIRAKRHSTQNTYSSVTFSPLDAKAGASVATGGVASSAVGTPGVVLGQWGFHQRGGYRWVSIPGGELVVPLSFSNGIMIEYYFTQGTDVNACSLFFDE